MACLCDHEQSGLLQPALLFQKRHCLSTFGSGFAAHKSCHSLAGTVTLRSFGALGGERLRFCGGGERLDSEGFVFNFLISSSAARNFWLRLRLRFLDQESFFLSASSLLSS